MSEYRSQRSDAIEDPLTFGTGFAVARLRGAKDRLQAVDDALAAALRLAGRLLGRTQAALERSRRRRLALRDLRALDDHLLADLGLSRPLLSVVASDLVRAGRPAETTRRGGRSQAAKRQRCGPRLKTCPAC